MAANIEIRKYNGIEEGSFAGFGPAWHGLGKVFDGPMTVIEALEASHANFDVTLQNIATIPDDIMESIKNGEMIDASRLQNFIISNKRATFRNDYKETLGVVSDSYGIIQNADAFKFIDSLCSCGAKDAPVIHSCGVLGKGERIFITAKFPEPVILNHANDDIVDMFIVFTTTHDGTGGCCAMVTPTRVVCQNTLNMAFANCVSRWNIRHTSGVVNRLQDATDAATTLRFYDIYRQEFEANMERLSKIQVSDKDIEKIAANISMSKNTFEIYQNSGFNLENEDISGRSRNKINDIIETIHSGVGQDQKFGEGNGLWVYNGITSYFANNTSYKNPTKRFTSLVDENGLASIKTNKAKELILGLAA